MMLDILYQDADLIAINKPSGLLVHRSPIDKHETQFAVQLLRDQIGQRVFPVHRLDKPTSGVLLFGLTSEAARQIASEWANVEKRYLALVRGALSSTTLTHPVRTIDEKGVERVQAAETVFTCLVKTTLPVGFGQQAADYPQTTFSLVEAMPKTGRQHQIRKHLKHLSHPIVGDTRYGKGDINRYFRNTFLVNRLMLHCQTLSLVHPQTGAKILITAPLDVSWQNMSAEVSQWENMIDRK